MLNIKEILKNSKEYKVKLESRGFSIQKFDEVIELGKNRTKLISEMEEMQHRRNALSKEIGILKRKNESVENILAELEEIKIQTKNLEAKNNDLQTKLNSLLYIMPNIPLDSVPLGNDEEDNKVIAVYDKLGRGLAPSKLPHYEIAEKLDLIDIQRAVKISGTRFVAYKGLGAKLVRALETFMLDTHIENGYTEFITPLLVTSETMTGTGQLPKFKDESFYIEKHDRWLIPTAEVPLTNFYSNEIIDLSKPLYLTAFSKCFRSEAGSGGKDTKGLIRTHQFNKVELVKIVNKNDYENEYKKTVSDAKNILELLELPFRELELCTGDLGFSSQYTIDLELWLPSEQKYRETSSISMFGTFQSRRASIRYRNEDGKTEYAYTINGSGLAIDRVVASILENYQNDDGTITVPKVLQKYMNIDIIK
ncbi:MAG: serine--tRNA ligase [Mycoplasma sp.]|nr:serine--tRNA ligase [Mycoplasma sp.]